MGGCLKSHFKDDACSQQEVCGQDRTRQQSGFSSADKIRSGVVAFHEIRNAVGAFYEMISTQTMICQRFKENWSLFVWDKIYWAQVLALSNIPRNERPIFSLLFFCISICCSIYRASDFIVWPCFCLPVRRYALVFLCSGWYVLACLLSSKPVCV